MPRKSLGNFAGFVLLRSWKGALVAGVQRGSGIAVRLLKREDGTPKLSPPIFLSSKKFALGLTVGVNIVNTCICLSTLKELNTYVTGHAASLGKEVDAPMLSRNAKEQSGIHVESVPTTANTGQGAAPPKVYSVTDSFMLVDLSLAGGMVTPHRELNQLAYGEGFDPERVLSGEVPVPDDLGVVYALLQSKFL